jgi:hypothetical protein
MLMKMKLKRLWRWWIFGRRGSLWMILKRRGSMGRRHWRMTMWRRMMQRRMMLKRLCRWWIFRRRGSLWWILERRGSLWRILRWRRKSGSAAYDILQSWSTLMLSALR